MLIKYNVEQDVPTLWCTNLSTMVVPKISIQYSWINHIIIKFHSLCLFFKENITTCDNVDTKEKLESFHLRILDDKLIKNLRGKLDI